MKGLGYVAVCIGLLVPTSAFAQSGGGLLPGPGFMPNPAKGKQLFDKNCAECHGANLKGTDKGPPLLHGIYEPNHHSDVSIQLAVKNGTRQHHWRFGDMAPVAGLTREDVGHITAYIRRQQKQAGVF